MKQIYVKKDGSKEVVSYMGDEAVSMLLAEAGVTEDVDLEIHRLSKYGVKINLVKGMCLHASFKFNVRTMSMERLG